MNFNEYLQVLNENAMLKQKMFAALKNDYEQECKACYGTGQTWDETCTHCGGSGNLTVDGDINITFPYDEIAEHEIHFSNREKFKEFVDAIPEVLKKYKLDIGYADMIIKPFDIATEQFLNKFKNEITQ